MKKWIIKTFGLVGSWKWAKKQMLNEKIVRCKHWTGTLKLRIDDSKNQLLLCTFDKNFSHYKWETSNHHLSYEDFTDYYVEQF